MKRSSPLLNWLLAGTLAMLTACASGPELVNHGFSYSFVQDSPEAELLDYRYGASSYGVSELKEMGRVSQGGGIFGEMRRGDDLYVKWRLRNTGEVFEETVDLKRRLPADIKGCRIYFMVRGPQLFVYLITPQRRANDEAPNGPSKTSYLKTITLYPDQPKR